MYYPFFFLFYLSYLNFLQAQSGSSFINQVALDEITVDLREPTYSEGVLTTHQGGVIQTPHLRIQAKTLCYKKRESFLTIEAEEDLIVEFGHYIFVGDEFFYDFQKKEGWIKNGRTAVSPWFFGGEIIYLLANGDYVVRNGYLTTSEKIPYEWGISSSSLILKEGSLIQAQHVKIKLFNRSIFSFPFFQSTVDSIFDSPFKYRFRWGGKKGPFFGLTYEIFSTKNWKTFLYFGGGLKSRAKLSLETRYLSYDKKTKFKSLHYLAFDSSLFSFKRRLNFRLEGSFYRLLNQDQTFILLTYDKVSGCDFKDRYYKKNFDFKLVKKTQILMRHQETNWQKTDWIAQFYARIRLNNFQTVKEVLPSLQVRFKPDFFYKTGILFDHWIDFSYLNFLYSSYCSCLPSYASSRFEYRPRFYRPFNFKNFFNFTPELEAVAILYGNSPQHKKQILPLIHTSFEFNANLYRLQGAYKHTIHPYLRYNSYLCPPSSVFHHYIFDIRDGLTKLNFFRFGVKNNLYFKELNRKIFHSWASDFYAYTFFNTQKFRYLIPRVYASFLFFFTPTLRHKIKTAWNVEHHQVDHFNIESGWTLNADLAFSTEFRYRSAYSWRKGDEENFFLDVFRSDSQLRKSPLSDRRNTFLVRFFYRFYPNWIGELTLQKGWNRIKEPSYLEFELNFITTFQTAWNLRLSLQRKKNDTRVAFYFNIGLEKAKLDSCNLSISCED